MVARFLAALIVATAIAAITACGGSQSPNTLAGPSQTPTIERFLGTWTSGTIGSATQNQCSKLDYTITRTSDSSASVTYDVTCSGVNVAGNGNGVLLGSALKWSASGTISGNAVPGGSCAFQFVDNTATPQGSDAIKVDYSGTVCGIPISGSQVLNRK